MRNKILIVLVAVVMALGMVMLAGCGDNSDILAQLEALKKEQENLKKEQEELKNNAIAMEARIAKLEATSAGIDELSDRIKTLEESQDTQLLTELKADLTKVEKALLQNTTDDATLKASVTNMQLKLDDINNSLTNVDVDLSKTQQSLNKLYGETLRVYDFEMDKVYECKLNGVLYFSAQIYYESHFTKIIDNPSDVVACVTNEEHVCGRIVIFSNLLGKRDNKEWYNLICCATEDDTWPPILGFVNKDGFVLSDAENKIGYKETKKWYFYFAKYAGFTDLKLQLMLPSQAKRLPITTINNFYCL